MPVAFIPFANLSFSSGRLNSAGLIDCAGVLANGVGYEPLPPLFYAGPASTVDVGSTTRGFASVNINPRTSHALARVNVFVNNYTDPGEWCEILWDSSYPLTLNAVLQTLNTADPVNSGFQSWAGQTLAVFGHDYAAQRLLEDGTLADLFAELPEEDDPKCYLPKPRYICSVGERILVGNLANLDDIGPPDPAHSLVWWSATDDPTVMTTPSEDEELLSDFQPISDDYGQITGLASGRRRCYVFKERAVYSMEVGGAWQFTVERIASDLGCVSARSIVSIADEVFFWSHAGPAVCREARVSLLSDGVMSIRGIEHESPPLSEFEVLSSACDIRHQLVLWLVSYNAYSFTYALDSDQMPVESRQDATKRYAILAYNALTQQLSFLARGGADGFVTRLEADGTLTTLRPIALVDRIPVAGHSPLSGVGLIAGVDGSPAGLYLFGYPSSLWTPERTIQQDCEFATGLVQFGQEMNVRVQRVRPIYRTRRTHEAPNQYVTVRTTYGPFDVERTTGPFHLKDRRGWITTPSAPLGNFVGISLRIPPRGTVAGIEDGATSSDMRYAADIVELEGVEIEYELASKR